MDDREQALRRLLRDSLQPEKEAPAFGWIWSAARAQAGQRQPHFAPWGDRFAAVAAVASVLLIGVFLALDARREHPDRAPDSALYAQLIAHTSWQSPTDALLDTPASRSLSALPELPTVNTNPPLESLL